MRRLLALLVYFGSFGFGAYAQTPQYHYVLEQFQRGKVLQKSGEINEVELNYNSLTSEMVFVSNGQYMALAEPDKVDTVFIGSRIFVPGDKKFYEVLLRGASPLLEEYTCSLKEQGNSIGYGMSSTTNSATQLRSMIAGGQAYGLKLPDGYTVIASQSFLVRVKGELKPANSERQLNACFTDKKPFIKNWVKEHHTNFSQSADMIALVEALQSSN